MPVIPVWFVTGNGPFSVVATPQTNTAGTLADTTPVQTITGSIDDVRVEMVIEHRDIRGSNRLQMNNVLVGEGVRLVLVEIIKYTGTNMLPVMAFSVAYWKIVVTRGAQAYTFYGIRGNLTEGIPNNEKATIEMAFEPIDPAAGNASYA